MLPDINSSYSILLPNNCYHFDAYALNGDPSVYPPFIHHLETPDIYNFYWNWLYDYTIIDAPGLILMYPYEFYGSLIDFIGFRYIYTTDFQYDIKSFFINYGPRRTKTLVWVRRQPRQQRGEVEEGKEIATYSEGQGNQVTIYFWESISFQERRSTQTEGEVGIHFGTKGIRRHCWWKSGRSPSTKIWIHVSARRWTVWIQKLISNQQA